MTKLFVILIGSLALAAAEWLDYDTRYLTVQTNTGKLQGSLGKSCRSGKPFAAFRGIPYAEPPVGKLRFKDPVRKTWEGVWDASYQRSSCLQLKDGVLLEGSSEDCLYMNIYTPNLWHLQNDPLAPDSDLKPVMVFIHPGAFTYGDSGEDLFSPDFLMDQDVVLVTFNYRLGALGFLSLQNEYVPGNAGLKDQNLVLRWVKENIREFGGNPSKITIFGQSAGSASVNYHLLSEKSKGLFDYAIMESGASLASWAFTTPYNALKKGINLVELLRCHRETQEKILECLQTVPAESIEQVQSKTISLQEYLTLGVIAFQPTIEPQYPGAFLTKHPYDLLESGNFTKVPTIIGMTADEGLFTVPELIKADPSGLLLSAMGLDLSRFIPQSFHVRPFTKSAVYAHIELSRFYFTFQRLSKLTMLNFTDLITDTLFTLPIQLTTSLLSEKGVPVYNYLFTYDGGYNTMKMAVQKLNIKGVFHGDDMGYLFYTPELHTQCSPNATYTVDERMIDRMTTMWTNFARTGNPNIVSGPLAPTNWEKFTKKDQDYLNIGTELVPSKRLKLSKILFWENLLSKLGLINTQETTNLILYP